MDLELVLTGDGGDLVKTSKDLSVIYGFENMPLLALFGGNVEMSTPNPRIATEQDFSFWGNNLLMPQDFGIQFNSQTEKMLNSVALNSSGRALIQQAVQNDLAFMSDFAIVKVSVTIIATDSVAIGIQLTQPDNLQQQDFVYIWNATKRELLAKEFTILTTSTIRVRYFDVSFDLFFE